MKNNGKETPIALMVGVQAHEDEAEPERVTNTYLVLAKITIADTCVTDRIPADSLSATELRRRADSVAQRPCLESQQRLIVR